MTETVCNFSSKVIEFLGRVRGITVSVCFEAGHSISAQPFKFLSIDSKIKGGRRIAVTKKLSRCLCSVNSSTFITVRWALRLRLKSPYHSYPWEVWFNFRFTRLL